MGSGRQNTMKKNDFARRGFIDYLSTYFLLCNARACDIFPQPEFQMSTKGQRVEGFIPGVVLFGNRAFPGTRSRETF